MFTVTRGGIVGLIAVMLVVFATSEAAAQQAPAAGPPGDSVKVFLDCMNVSCDFDFFRTEITFVDYVRDRKQADVHLLITMEGTGGGGENYTLSFIGLGRFAGVDHLLHYVSRVTNTPDETRRDLASTITLGLVHYVAQTSVAPELQITRTQPKSGPSAAAPVRDPSNFWYMSANISLYSIGEQLTNSTDVYGSLTASRVTEACKMKLSGDFDYGRSRYTFSDGTDFVNISRTYGATAHAVKSLTPHWSAGARTQASRSTYSKRRLLLSVTIGAISGLRRAAGSGL